jgi:hypothetical protein
LKRPLLKALNKALKGQLLMNPAVIGLFAKLSQSIIGGYPLRTGNTSKVLKAGPHFRLLP